MSKTKTAPSKLSFTDRTVTCGGFDDASGKGGGGASIVRFVEIVSGCNWIASSSQTAALTLRWYVDALDHMSQGAVKDAN